jgi:hypothetical protein
MLLRVSDTSFVTANGRALKRFVVKLRDGLVMQLQSMGTHWWDEHWVQYNV